MRMGLDCAYVIKGKSRKDIYYYDSEDDGWTTAVWCTKFGLYREAKRALGKALEYKDGWVTDIKIVKIKIEEV